MGKRAWFLAVCLLLGGCARVPRVADPTALSTAPPPTSTLTRAPGVTTVELTATPQATNGGASQPTVVSRATATPPPNAEQPVREISLAGPLASDDAQLSGLAWFGDTLILLPQYPDDFAAQGEGVLFALPKADILAFLDGSRTEPLTPLEIPLVAPDLQERIDGFQGFEAIGVADTRLFVTIEAEAGDPMMGYLLTGTLAPDLSEARLDLTTLTEIRPQAALSNLSDEALLMVGDQAVTLYEANGKSVNPAPVAHRFDLTAATADTIPFPSVEYRITDATPVDEAGRFWAINVFWPRDLIKLRPSPDALVARFGEGPSHDKWLTVERLVEFQYSADAITLTDTPPIQLELINDLNTRNWEGIARLDTRGFLVVTDSFPRTILALVNNP